MFFFHNLLSINTSVVYKLKIFSVSELMFEQKCFN